MRGSRLLLQAQDVEKLGGTLVCKAPVRHIAQTQQGVAVNSDAGT